MSEFNRPRVPVAEEDKQRSYYKYYSEPLVPGDPAKFQKVLSKQLKELVDDGLVTRVQYDAIPPRTEYFLTDWGKELIGALDLLYVWSVRRLHELKLPIDPDAFYAHQDEKYVQHVGHIMEEQESEWRSPSRTPKLWPEEWHEQNAPDGK